MAERERKIILIGSKGYERAKDGVRVDCREWSDIEKIKNIRDYDTIVLNIIKLKEEGARTKIEWKTFTEIFNFNNAIDVLLHGGEIIIIGDPRFEIAWSKDIDAEKLPDKVEKVPFLDWTGINFLWDSAPGDTIQFQNDYRHKEYEEYISHLRRWNYSLQHCEISSEKLSSRFNLESIKRKNCEISLYKDFYCTNRYGNALAFTLRYRFLEHGRYEDKVIQPLGPILLLPEIALNEDETLQIVLRDICGIQTALPEPVWLTEYKAPGQAAIDDEIGKIDCELDGVLERLEKAKEKREDVRKCLKLLYEREYALEPIVRDILRGLGAHIEDPSEKNKEDGWIVVTTPEKTYEGVLEIKSTKSDQFGEDGRKQLLDWIDRGRTLRSKNYKGIFIGNSAVNKPLKERSWAFSDSWQKAAELSDICALKTEDLYVIHLLHSKGAISIVDFWKSLFETNGILDMKEYWALLAPKDES